EHVKGVTDVVSGFAGGSGKNPSYQEVSSGNTGHAESVRITYDPSQITYAKLLEIFFTVAHDPTQLNRQGPDVGPQYRSAIYYLDAEQERTARAYIAQLERGKVFAKRIVTEVAPLEKFYLAEAYHQDFAARNPNAPYIVIHDRPKVAQLQKRFPELYRAR
ncbi:MAG TPA: peptide-methionine (S)-S-oxide reductase MsrA, partial [Longimicrobiales bacterium]|nr:peptide-methionine (S)-S-oxide reductase MsrA [Longimicrobiales bacterium]